MEGDRERGKRDVYIYIYIYIHAEREGDRETLRERKGGREAGPASRSSAIGGKLAGRRIRA
jgi:hypothetical protein